MTREFLARRGDTRFRLSSDRELAAPALRLALPWGSLEFDPLRPGRVTKLILELEQIGDSTASDLLGEQIGSAVNGTKIAIDDDFDRSFADLARAALVEWTFRWDSRNLAAEDLDLDRAAALHRGGFTLWSFRSFDRTLPRLLRLLSRAADRPLPARLRQEMLGIAEAAIDSLGPNHPRYSELVVAVDRATDSDAIPDTVPDLAALESLFPAPVPVAAAMFASDGFTLPGLRFGVSAAGLQAPRDQSEPESHEQPFDWWRVPPRLLADPVARFTWTYYPRTRKVRVSIPTETAGKQPSLEPLIARLGRTDGEVVDEAQFIDGEVELDAADIRKRPTSRSGDAMVVEVAHRHAKGPIPVGRARLVHDWQRHAVSAINNARTVLAAASIGQRPPDTVLDSIELQIRDGQAGLQQVSRLPADMRRGPGHDLDQLANWLDDVAPSQSQADPNWIIDPFSSKPARPLLAELLLVFDTTGKSRS